MLTAGKFCGQASGTGVAEEWYARTALEDLSGIPPELINDDRLYRGLDHLGKHKDRLCEHLMQMFAGGQTVDYFPLTSERLDTIS